jgi:hypothetical protein
MTSMLESLLAASEAERALLWIEVRRELVSHERSEVRELYPVLRMSPDTRTLADHHDDEARELEQLIGMLDTVSPLVETWRLLAVRLAETVVAHAAEEESAIFPRAQSALGEARSVELEATVLDAKQKVAEQM